MATVSFTVISAPMRPYSVKIDPILRILPQNSVNKIGKLLPCPLEAVVFVAKFSVGHCRPVRVEIAVGGGYNGSFGFDVVKDGRNYTRVVFRVNMLDQFDT